MTKPFDFQFPATKRVQTSLDCDCAGGLLSEAVNLEVKSAVSFHRFFTGFTKNEQKNNSVVWSPHGVCKVDVANTPGLQAEGTMSKLPLRVPLDVDRVTVTSTAMRPALRCGHLSQRSPAPRLAI